MTLSLDPPPPLSVTVNIQWKLLLYTNMAMKVCMWYRVWMVGGYALRMYPLSHATQSSMSTSSSSFSPHTTHLSSPLSPPLSSVSSCCCSSCSPYSSSSSSSSSSAAASPTVSLCCKYFCIMLWVQGFFAAPVVSFQRFLWQWPALFLWKKRLVG